jgi:1-pyrroline-5-carboxylate dehydrogenase
MVMLIPFKNESLPNFDDEQVKNQMLAALKRVHQKKGDEHPLIIGGKPIKAEQKFKSINPADKDEVVGLFQKASKAQVGEAIDAAWKSFEDWKFMPVEERAMILIKTAALMRTRKLDLAATMIYEVGKTWREAAADVAEAIDFCEYYAREILRYSKRDDLTPIDREFNEIKYIPLGVGAVIPPWNFPMAILVGMTTAALAGGNCVLLKPSSDAPWLATKFVHILMEAGLPEGVINLMTGSGAEVGDTIVTHPKTRFIAFTGSKEVGLRINRLAAQTSEDQKWIKRVTVEMGGKDAIIVDKDVDLDAAVQAIIISAYGFQGQKCSACSRAIIHRDCYDTILEKLKASAERLVVGLPELPETQMGPVINASALKNTEEYIEIGKQEGRLITGGERSAGNGFFIKPTIFSDIDPNARLAQEEIFAPVLAVIKADTFDDALEIANNSLYGLTGSIFSRSRRHIVKGKRVFHVGNLYINRNCTGALVDVHPFGGFNMSGTDSKAGGRDYIGLFTQIKAISERYR